MEQKRCVLKGWLIAMLTGDSYVARSGGGWLIWSWGGAVIIELAYTLRGPWKQLHIHRCQNKNIFRINLLKKVFQSPNFRNLVEDTQRTLRERALILLEDRTHVPRSAIAIFHMECSRYSLKSL